MQWVRAQTFKAADDDDARKQILGGRLRTLMRPVLSRRNRQVECCVLWWRVQTMSAAKAVAKAAGVGRDSEGIVEELQEKQEEVEHCQAASEAAELLRGTSAHPVYQRATDSSDSCDHCASPENSGNSTCTLPAVTPPIRPEPRAFTALTMDESEPRALHRDTPNLRGLDIIRTLASQLKRFDKLGEISCDSRTTSLRMQLREMSKINIQSLGTL